MNKDKYIQQIESKLRANFHIEKDVIEDNIKFEMIARYHNISGRMFISKVDIIDQYETFENCYLKCIDVPEIKDILEYFDIMIQKSKGINPGKDHFYTDVTGIIVAEKLPLESENTLKKLKFGKTFRLMWRGFTTVRLICVELSTGNVFSNKAGREIKKVYNF